MYSYNASWYFFRTKKYVSVTSVLIPSLSSPAKAFAASSSAIRSASSISSSVGDGGDEEEEAVISTAAMNEETSRGLILGFVVRIEIEISFAVDLQCLTDWQNYFTCADGLSIVILYVCTDAPR